MTTRGVCDKFGKDPAGELFFLIKKDPTICEEVVDLERVISSDTADGESLSGEDGEHRVERLVLCSLVNCKCSPLLQGFLHEEELCLVALTCHCSLDVWFLSERSGSLFLEFF